MTAVKTFKDMAAQGDVIFRRIDKLPDGLVEVPRKGSIVVAHSETGHHHTADEPHIRLFEKATRDPMVCYLSIGEVGDDEVAATFTHHRPHDTHATLQCLGGGFLEVRRQEEYTPAGWRRVED